MDLTKLSVDEKKELLKLLRKKSFKKEEDRLNLFKPNNVQHRFFKSQKRIRAMLAGNGTGKTVAIIIELLYTHLRCHPYRPNIDTINKTWFICPDYKKIEDYVDLIKKYCPPSQMPEFNKLGTPNIRRIEWQNGTTTTFFSHEQEPKAFEGTNIDALFLEEPCPRDIYVASYRGLRGNPNHFVAIAATMLDSVWLYTDFYRPWLEGNAPHIDIFTGTVEDNRQNVSSQWIAEYFGSLTSEEYDARFHGKPMILQGVVFKEFSRKSHVIPSQDWPQDWPVYVAVDPHTRKLSTALWIGVTKDEDLVVINEAAAGSIEELGKKINEIEATCKYRVVKRRIDNSGSGRDWDGRTALEIFYHRCGLRFSPMRAEEKAVSSSIIKIKQRLALKADGKPTLFVMDHCKGFIRDMELYGWKENANEASSGQSEKPKKVNDDYIDPCRYIIMSNPVYKAAVEIYTPKTAAYSRKPHSIEETEIDSLGRKWR